MSLRVFFQPVPNIDKTRLWFFHKFEIRVLYDRLDFNFLAVMLPREVVFYSSYFFSNVSSCIFQSLPNIDKTCLWFFHKFELRILYTTVLNSCIEPQFVVIFFFIAKACNMRLLWSFHFTVLI